MTHRWIREPFVNIGFKASPVFYGKFVGALIVYVDKKCGLHAISNQLVSLIKEMKNHSC